MTSHPLRSTKQTQCLQSAPFFNMNKNLLFFAVLFVLNYHFTECWDYPQYNLKNLFQFGKTGWDKASALVRRAVGVDVTGVEVNGLGGTKLPIPLNATGNVTDLKGNSPKNIKSNLNDAMQTGSIHVKDRGNEILQKIQTATDKIETLLKLFNVADNNGGNMRTETSQSRRSTRTTTSTTAPIASEAQHTTVEPYPGAYMGYNPIIDITNGTHSMNIYGRSKSPLRRRRSLRRRYISESMGRNIRRRRKPKPHKMYHKAPKPKHYKILNSSATNTKHHVAKYKKKRGQSETADVLKVMWSMQKMIHKLGHVLTMDVRKLGNQAVDNTNEERADIRANSDRMSQMQVRLSGNINDIRYNISNLISSQKELGKSVSVALENMMVVLNQMVGIITRRDEQIEQLGKIKSLGLNLTSPEFLLNALRNSTIYKKELDIKKHYGSDHIKLPKSSLNVSSPVKIIRSKAPAKNVDLKKKKNKKNNHEHATTNKVSQTGNVTSKVGTYKDNFNKTKEHNKTMSENDHKNNNKSSKADMALKNGNKTDAKGRHRIYNSTEFHGNKTNGNTNNQEAKIKNGNKFGETKTVSGVSIANKDSKHGTGRLHGNATSSNKHYKHENNKVHNNKTVENHHVHQSVVKNNGSNVGHGNFTSGITHKHNTAKKTHGNGATKNKNHGVNVDRKNVATGHKHKSVNTKQIIKEVAIKHKNHGRNDVHGKDSTKSHHKEYGTKKANKNKSKVKKCLTKHCKHNHKNNGNIGRKMNIKNTKTKSNTYKAQGNKKHSDKKGTKVRDKHKMKQKTTFVSKTSNREELSGNKKGSNGLTGSPENQARSSNKTILPISVTKPNIKISGTTIKQPASIIPSSPITASGDSIKLSTIAEISSFNQTAPKTTSNPRNIVTQSANTQTTPDRRTKQPFTVIEFVNNQTTSEYTTKIPSIVTGSQSRQTTPGSKTNSPIIATNTPTNQSSPPSENVTTHSNSVTEPSKMQAVLGNTTQQNTNMLTSKGKIESGNSSTHAKLLSNAKNALDISASKQTTPVPTAKIVNSVKQQTEVKKGHQSSNNKNKLNKQDQPESGNKDTSKTDKRKTLKPNDLHMNKSINNVHSRQKQGKSVSTKKPHGKSHDISHSEKPHGHKHGGRHDEKSNELKETHKNGKLRTKNKNNKQNVKNKLNNHVKNAKISNFHNNHSVLNKFKNIKHTVYAEKGKNIHKGKTAIKGHNIRKVTHSKKGHVTHNGKYGKKGQNIHKRLHGKKEQNIHKGIRGKTGQNTHKRINGKKGQNIHRGINGIKAQNFLKGKRGKKGQNIHKGRTESKGHNIHKGITAKNGQNVNKRISSTKRQNIHKVISAKKGQKLNKGISAKKGKTINKVTKTKLKTKPSHGNKHHGKKQVHRRTKRLDNILRGLFKETKRKY